MLTRISRNISVGLKIFGMQACLLVILAAVSMGNYYYMDRVNDHVTDMAKYIAPIKAHIAKVNMFALEQEVLFEQILRLYVIKPLDMEKLNVEIGNLLKFEKLMDREIERSIHISEVAAMASPIINDVIEFARLKPMLKMLEEDHQVFQEHIFRIIELEKHGKKEEAKVIDELLDEREEIFDKRVRKLLAGFERFTEQTIQQIDLHEQKLMQYNLSLSVFATVTGLILAMLVTLRLVRPVKDLIQNARAVRNGNLDSEANTKSNDEIGKLAGSFNSMLKGVRQKKQLKESFGQYIDPRIVELLLQSGQESMKNSKQVMTVFFSDLAKFSSISEMLTPVRLVDLINEYLTLATEPITNYKGVVDKFIGDAIVAFWGPPFVSESEQARLACRSALEQFTQIEKLQHSLPDIVGIRKGLPKISARVGLDTGEVIVGNVGSSYLKSFTIIGHAVDTAEKLEGANKIYGTRILLSNRTRELAGDYIETRKVDWLPLGDKGEDVAIYELLGIAGNVDKKVMELRDGFEQGLAAYREKDRTKAGTLFESCLRINPEDGPSKYYMDKLN